MRLTGLCLLVWTTAATAAEIEQRYVTTWSPSPVARLSLAESIELTGVRCRVQEGVDSWGAWWPGRQITWNRGPQAWHLPLGHLDPGEYSVQHDLRTPLGADWRKGRLRVPVVARYTGQPITTDGNLTEWPQARLGAIRQDWPDLWFAWDTQALYLARAGDQGGVLGVELYPLPGTPHKVEITLRGVRTEHVLPWTGEMRLAGPQLGTVLRIARSDRREEQVDLLLVGSGVELYFGTTWVSGDAGHDDQGPPREVLRSIEDRIPGITLRSTGTNWGAVEPVDTGEDAPRYDWSVLEHDPVLTYRGLVYTHVDTWNDWAEPLREKDPARYDQRAQRYVRAFATQMKERGIRYFSCGYNEPELFHVSNREQFFNEPLTRDAEALRSVLPDAQIIAGKFSGGDPGVIRSFVRGGFRDNFDVLDIHPYANDPRTGLAMGGVVAAHEVLEELGMGHKRIFLGEGWGPTRNLPQVNRPRHDDPVSPREADLMRQYYWNGYRCLTQPRTDYNPEWVLGAKFFTLNDNISSTYWRVNARPHYNAKGEIEYYLLSHLAFASLEGMDPAFWNGGLVDFYGRPKGEWLFDFPPSLPQVRTSAEIAVPWLLRNRPVPVRVRVVNAESDEINDIALGVRHRTQTFGEGAVHYEITNGLPGRLPGLSWHEGAEAMVTVVGGNSGPLRLAVEVDYKWRGVQYVADAVLRTELRDDVTLEQAGRLQVTPGTTLATGQIVVRNNCPDRLQGPLFADLPQGLTVELEPQEIPPLEQGQSAVFALRVDTAAVPAGLHTLRSVPDPQQGVIVHKPLIFRRLANAPEIDADLADWPSRDALTETILFAGTRGLDRLDLPVPFPVPTPQQTVRQSNAPREPSQPSASANTLDARAVCGWDNEFLYLGIVVDDKIHHQPQDGMAVWKADSVQIAIDPLGDGPPLRAASVAEKERHSFEENYNADDYELSLALTPHGPQVTVIRAPLNGPTGVITRARLEVRYTRTHAIYEAAIPWSALPPLAPSVRGTFAMDLLINDSDGGERFTLGWADGIANGKYPSRFVPVWFQEP